MSVLNDAQAIFFYLLDGPVREYALLLSISEETLNGAIREADFFCTVWEVLLDLIVLEFEYLKPIGEGCLRSLRFREEVYYFTASKCLFNVLVLEKHHLVAVWPYLTLYAILEDDLLLAALIELLALTFLTDYLIDEDKILVGLVGVVLFWEDKIVVILLFFLIKLIRILIARMLINHLRGQLFLVRVVGGFTRHISHFLFLALGSRILLLLRFIERKGHDLL